ncbi:MAG: PhoH family protein [Pseudomonadota bacterium]
MADTLSVEFEDNAVLARLLGEFDSHLALLEDRLGVVAVPRGNVILLSGPQSSRETARAVLLELYDRLEDGADISAGDVDGAIRHAAGADATAGTSARSKNLRRSAGRSSRRDEKSPANGSAAVRGGAAQIKTRKRQITARTPMQSAYIRALEATDLVFGVGPAGTGKTYLAVAFAASLLEKGLTERLILSRPAVEAGERLGFLPGDMRDKVDPYLRPLYDALYDVLPPEKVEKGIEAGVIEIAPLAFMRGRTLGDCVVILDEAQNCTTMQMKMFLTRLGEHAKMVITGDPSQVDLPPGQQSGLRDALNVLADEEEISIVRFAQQDVVRRELVARIVAAYDRVEQEDDRRGGAGN